MAGTSGAGSYRALFDSPVVARTFVLAMVGRFGYAVLPLVLLFTVAQATGSFPVAATASALFGLSGLAMPAQARLIDRFTQARVLPIVGAVFASSLAAMSVVAAQQVTAPAAWTALGLLAGAVAPSLGPSMRAQWRVFQTGTGRSTAYALDAVAEEAVFLLGPVAASAVLATGAAYRGLPVVAGLVSVGIIGLVTSPAARNRQPTLHGTTPARSRGPLRRPGFLLLCAAMLFAGAGAAAALTGTAAQTDVVGHPEWAGMIEAAAGVGAVLGGLAWGRRRVGGPWSRHLLVLLGLRGVVTLGAALAASIPGTAISMTLAGALMSPMFVVAFTAADALTPPDRQTEASTWVTTAHNLGSSGGTAAAGWAVGHLAVGAPFVLSAGALLLAGVLGSRGTS